MATNSISPDSKELESALRDLNPAALDQDFLSRLEDAAGDTLTALTAQEIQFEKFLRTKPPAALPADFLLRLESVVSDLPFAVDHKILLFPKTAPVVSRQAPRKSYSTWAAAAAIALIGGATALLIPTRPPVTGGVARQSAPVIARDNSNIVTTSFGDAVDEGISWHQADQPHRVLRMTYVDRVSAKDPEGKTIEVEQPRTEYILIPEKMD